MDAAPHERLPQVTDPAARQQDPQPHLEVLGGALQMRPEEIPHGADAAIPDE